MSSPTPVVIVLDMRDCRDKPIAVGDTVVFGEDEGYDSPTLSERVVAAIRMESITRLNHSTRFRLTADLIHAENATLDEPLSRGYISLPGAKLAVVGKAD